MKCTFDNQRGQVIILFVLALVGLLAFAGLAVDGAMLYSDRRAAQSAADSAALAGAGAGGNTMQLRNIYATQDFKCRQLLNPGSKMDIVQNDMIDAAISRASINGYLIDDDLADKNGVKVSCNDGNDKVVDGHLLASDSVEKYMDVEVQVTAPTRSSFIHLVFNQLMQNTVTAIARIRPLSLEGGGAGIIALNQTECKQGGVYVGGIYLDGTTIDIRSNGGGLSSNTCIIRNGNSEVIVENSNPAGFARTSPDWTNDAVFVDEFGNPLILRQSATYQINPSFDAPDCSIFGSAQTYTHPDYTHNLNPGIYPNGITHDATLNSGLYCIDQNPSGKIGNLTNIDSDHGVTLYIRSGSISMSGSDSLRLYALLSSADPVNGAVPGLVLYVANGDFTMTGSSTADFSGTIYVPNGTIDLGGAMTSEIWESVLIANNVKIHGNPFASLIVDYTHNLTDPSKLDLLR